MPWGGGGYLYFKLGVGGAVMMPLQYYCFASKVLSSEKDLAESGIINSFGRSFLKGEAGRFLENLPAHHPVRAL